MTKQILMATLVSVSAFAQAQVEVNGAEVKVNAGGTQVNVNTGTPKKKVEVSTPGASVKVNGPGASVRVGEGQSAVRVGAPPPPRAPVPDLAPPAQPLLIEGSEKNVKHTCAPGQDVKVSGSSNSLRLHGPCRGVAVEGSGNKVEVDQVQAISVEGSDNAVKWHTAPSGGQPTITSEGADNRIVHERDHR